MTISLLEYFVVGQLFAFMLIFTRIGAAIMLLPGIGAAYVSTRIRLHLALAISLLLVPLFYDIMPPMPTSPYALAVLLSAEFFIGLFLGSIARVLLMTLQTAGSIIAYQSSLALATVFDATQGQTSLFGSFLVLMATVMIFVMDIHHIMLSGLADSYTLFPPGDYPIMADMADHYTQLVSKTFSVAIQISSAHIVFALIFYLSAGVLSRIMPAIQVFFILMPAQIMISFFLLLAVLTSLMVYYMQFVEETLLSFIGL